MTWRLSIVAGLTMLVLGLGCGSGVERPAPEADDDLADDDGGDDDGGDDDSEACEFDQIEADPDGSLFGAVSLAEDLQPRIDAGCDCHQQGNPSIEDLSPGKTWSNWVDAASIYDPGEILVTPGDPEDSVVFWKVFGCYPLFPYVGEEMPPNAAPLALDEVTLYYNWILQGAEDN